MTLRRLQTAVCLLAVLSICTPVLPAWAADHDANTCAAGGGGGGSGGGGGGGGSGGSGGGGGGSGGGSSGAGSSGASGASGGSAGSTGAAAAASSVGVGPAADSVAPAHNGGVGLGLGTAIRGVGNGGVGGNDGGVDAGGDPSGATSLQSARPYSLRAIYFRRDQFRSTADCLTAAHTQRLPLEVCQ
jgi:hypothetical protein